MNKLSTKRKLFVKQYVKNNGNGTKTAMQIYNTKNADSARATASRVLANDNVQEELQRILQNEELELKSFTSKMSDIIQSEPSKGYSGADIVEIIKTGLKLHGVLSDRKVTTSYTINADLAKLSEYDLIERHKKLTRDTEAILQEDDT